MVNGSSLYYHRRVNAIKTLKLLLIITFMPLLFKTVAAAKTDNDYYKEIGTLNARIKDISQFHCPPMNIFFSVKPIYGTEKIDYTKSKDEINNLRTANAAKSNSPLKPLVSPNAKLEVHGLTEITDAYRMAFPYRVLEASFKLNNREYTRYCLVANKITYELGAKEINVRIPSEYYFTNGCVRKAVLEHEDTHVLIFRKALSKYAKIEYNEGQKILNSHKSLTAQTSPQAAVDEYQSVINEIQAMIKKYSELMHKELALLNDQFDIDEHKRDILKTKCGFVPKRRR